MASLSQRLQKAQDQRNQSPISSTLANAYIVSQQAAIEVAYWNGEYGDPRSAAAKATYSRLCAAMIAQSKRQ